ncbi:MAG: DNA adenine methylase [Micropruina glycogenica]
MTQFVISACSGISAGDGPSGEGERSGVRRDDESPKRLPRLGFGCDQVPWLEADAGRGAGRPCAGAQVRTAVDLFTGSARVAQVVQQRGLAVTAADLASYSEILACCYIVTDADAVDLDELDALLAESDALPGFAATSLRRSASRPATSSPTTACAEDAIRHRLVDLVDHPLYPVLLTALIEAADRRFDHRAAHGLPEVVVAPVAQRGCAAASSTVGGH